MSSMNDHIRWFNEVSSNDIGLVGGKNASLGELIKIGVDVPAGFAVTSHVYEKFIEYNGLSQFIEAQLSDLNINDVKRLETISNNIRKKILSSPFPKDLEDMILDSYQKLCEISHKDDVNCAVRSSATAEDLPTASFAGQQETFLNVRGKDDLLEKIRECFSSLFTSRAIFYRKEKGFDGNVKMSVGVQKLVNSEKSGVMFTIEPNSGNNNLIVIDSSYGLGEFVVSGKIVPDQFLIFKPTMQLIRSRIADKRSMLVPDGNGTKSLEIPESKRNKSSLTGEEINRLTDCALSIQKHYRHSMDIEWAIENGSVNILQARQETVHSNAVVEDTYKLLDKGNELIKGIAIGRKIACGKVKILNDPSEMHKFNQGDILVTRMTTPNWVPIMNKASAIITEEGGTTSHAAIVSRELGIPCVVGASGAIKILSKYENQEITVDCSNGIGEIYEGRLNFVREVVDLRKLPKTKTQIMMNISIPDAALHHANKCEGVGLLRLEFVYAHEIGIHPLALINYNQLKQKAVETDGQLRKALMEIEERTKGYENKEDYFVEKLSEGIAVIAAAVYPNDAVVRFSDFKTNEYRGLTGGYLYESEESNPMLGWRGASRYVHPAFEPAFRLECRAIKAVREKGLKNIIPEIPFCRTTRELVRILEIMEEEDLRRGDLKVCLMAEVPSNIWNAEEFCKYVDEFSIGSNDLTQLILGVDRDSGSMAGVTFDERDAAVKTAISHLIKVAHKNGKKVGICGQAPSDYPDFVEFLIKEGIDSISLNPDVLGKTRKLVAKIEDRMMVRPVNLSDSIVFLRVDMNTPTDKVTGRLLDEHRIMDGVNAIKWCFENGAYSAIIVSHQGRKKEDTLKNHVPVIERYFPGRVKFVGNISDLPNAIKNCNAGDILLLENIRSLDEEKDYTDVTKTIFYKTLKDIEGVTSKKIIYAKDDLAVCHRKDLTTYGLPMQLKSEGYEVVAGQLIKNELVRARIAKEKMEKGNVICLWGGGKFEDYLHLFEPFSIRYKNSTILTAGPLALLMLKATGKNIGENEKLFGITQEFIGKASQIMSKYSDRIIIPKDFYVENDKGKELVGIDNLNGMVVDIGPETVETYRNILSKNPGSIIVGNGPLGEYEKLLNAKGTIQVYTEVFNPMNKHFVIGGGGDFNTMMDILGFKPDMRSSGGKAFLELLVFGTLPGLEPLELSME